ncbi:MAG: DUF881 domain-containing protein [Mycobacteriales bacterium]
MRSRRWQAQLTVAVLAALLGFGLAVQVRTTQDRSALGSARPDDLLRIIDDLSARSERLAKEEADLRAAGDRLANAVDRDAAAVEEARKRIAALSILAGTVAAHGPGVQVVVDDPGHKLTADFIVDVIQEFRDAGAETMMINGHRVGASTYAVDNDVQIVLDGATLSQPYTIIAIGDAPTMATALAIPGGIVETAEDKGARISVTQSADVVVDALRPLSTPRYARPDSSE